MISNFQELLVEARNQKQPQRLLFLFAKADAKKKKSKHKSGTITPVMCVDKLPDEILDFSSFVKEADGISQDWDFMMAAGLNGQQGEAPTTEDAEPYLNRMANQVTSGEDLSNYVIFDRKENPIIIQTR